MLPGSTRRDLGWAASLAHTVDRRMTPPEDHSSAVARYAGAIAAQPRLAGRGARPDPPRGHAPRRRQDHASPTASCAAHRLSPRRSTTSTCARHPVLGAELVCRVEGLGPAAPGSATRTRTGTARGYPDGLSGDAIPLGSRILHVAHAFASMTGRRAYSESMSAEAALEELQRGAGMQFDPVLRRGARGAPQRLRRDGLSRTYGRPRPRPRAGPPRRRAPSRGSGPPGPARSRSRLSGARPRTRRRSLDHGVEAVFFETHAAGGDLNLLARTWVIGRPVVRSTR